MYNEYRKYLQPIKLNTNAHITSMSHSQVPRTTTHEVHPDTPMTAPNSGPSILPNRHGKQASHLSFKQTKLLPFKQSLAN